MLRKIVIWLMVLILVSVLDRFVSPKTLLIVILAVLACGIVLVTVGTVAKGDWGMNFSAVSCPRCCGSLPSQREPANRRQRLWGGWTCSACGAEFDKWGREVTR
jgi:hypothetical protein